MILKKKIGTIHERDYKIPLDNKKSISLIGVSGSGKSFLLYHLIEQLKKKEPKHAILYINFEDDRLFGITVKDLDNLITAYFELYPDKIENLPDKVLRFLLIK